MKIKAILFGLLLSAATAASWKGAQVAYIRLAQIRGGSPGRIVTDNGTTAQWVPMSGDANIASSGAVTVGKANGNTFPASVASGDLVYGSGASTLSKLAIGSAGQILTVVSGLPVWAASNGLPSGGTNGQTLRMNGSTPAWSSTLTNDGANVGIGQSPDSGAALSITGTGVQNGLSIVSATGNTVTPALKLQNNVGPVIYAVSTASPGTTSGAGYSAFTNTNSLVAGNRLGAFNFGTFVSGTSLTAGALQAFANESWDTSARGVDLKLSLIKPGTTTLTDRQYWYGDGDISLYASGSEGATSATSGFVFIPTSNGVPTGAPSSIVGAAGIKLNRSNNALYASYGGSAPTPVTMAGQSALATSLLASGGGATSSSIASATDVVFIDTSAGGVYTATLPAAASRLGKPVTIRRLAGGLANVVINRTGSDTVEGGTSVSLTTTGTVTLIPNGTDWVKLSASAN